LLAAGGPVIGDRQAASGMHHVPVPSRTSGQCSWENRTISARSTGLGLKLDGAIQVKLLRVLQDRNFQRLGETMARQRPHG
jgi:hypothetical protein